MSTNKSKINRKDIRKLDHMPLQQGYTNKITAVNSELPSSTSQPSMSITAPPSSSKITSKIITHTIIEPIPGVYFCNEEQIDDVTAFSSVSETSLTYETYNNHDDNHYDNCNDYEDDHYDPYDNYDYDYYD